MKVLLLGKDGSLGWQLQRSLEAVGDVTAYGRDDCDLEDTSALVAAVRAVAPDVIANAAAYTAVDLAENDRFRARAVNTEAVAVLAAEAARCDAWLVHYSSDYVFDGSKASPYVESDSMAPLNVYGRSKADADQSIADSGCRHLIFRCSWVYGERGENFARTLLQLAVDREALDVVSDQVGAPTGSALIADITAICLHRLHVDDALAARAGGLYNLAAAGETSWHGYARFLLSQAIKAGISLNIGLDEVRAVRSDAYPRNAARPLNSRLDTAKLRATFGLSLPPWNVGVTRWVEQYAALGRK